MKSIDIRLEFFKYFRDKQHQIVDSAPIVIKNDPTLMFTNAGMNQFKDYFLGTKEAKYKRVADFQKCLRVSGKHNDLEEVGVDHYHHTMFEMMGNWSFGDYFKEKAIDFAYDFLVNVCGLEKDRLYFSVFEGKAEWNLEADEESISYWKKYTTEDRILKFDAKDNFWEMGDTGPCGPCSEIHYDMRNDKDRAEVAGHSLVNADHEEVIEIWNLVFIQFNRKKDGSLELLKEKHVDTGMGFERLARALQKTSSNYDTDIFSPLIKKLESITGKKYEKTQSKKDIAFRVIVDHIRTIAFAISDEQLPSNTGAGYVIRRVLRRAVRYAYSFLDVNEPFLYQLIPVLVDQFKEFYSNIESSRELIEKVIRQEESSFLKTLETGIKRFDSIINDCKSNNINIIDGKIAFELYDTYGFPIDLTRLMASEAGYTVDEKAYTIALNEQKDRARAATKIDTDDWIVLKDDPNLEFVGYDESESDTKVIQYRKVKKAKKEMFQIVLDKTPFYAESGGQIGDTGSLMFGDENIKVIDTQKENDLIVHIVPKLPKDIERSVIAKIDTERRTDIIKNHSATHLLQAALKQVLGDHINQKGSLVADDYLRFDFSHFSKVSDEELQQVEDMVNEKIRANILKEEERTVPIAEAKERGAMALFGEKYGETVRVITFDKNYSIELCGGVHVDASGEIGYFKITSEAAIASGIRRIEAVTGKASATLITENTNKLADIKAKLKSSGDISLAVAKLLEENNKLKKEIESLEIEAAESLKDAIKNSFENSNGVNIAAINANNSSAAILKKISYDLKNEVDNLILIMASVSNNKPLLSLIINDKVQQKHNLNAGQIIRTIAKNIKGGGGGQANYATAGGSDPSGIETALAEGKKMINEAISG